MPNKQIVIHTSFLLLLPLIVAVFGISFWGALLLVIAALAWRWVIVLLGIAKPAGGPDLVLETISASHYVEKVRWCLDRLGVEYQEQPWGGTLGAFYKGRTVPRLTFRTGIVYSQIGNSPEILRYLWGAYAATRGERAEFLRPTAERLALEQRFDRYGRNLQVWVYFHVLDDPELCKHLWGMNNPATPWWQRKMIGVLFPLQAFLISRSFRTTVDHYTRSCEHIETLLAEMNELLADGRGSILGGDEINYTDLAFAALSGLWLQPANYGADAASAVRVEHERLPVDLRRDVTRWTGDYPHATAFVQRMYDEEREPTARVAGAGE
jgi:glutathione S-transferase